MLFHSRRREYTQKDKKKPNVMHCTERTLLSIVFFFVLHRCTLFLTHPRKVVICGYVQESWVTGGPAVMTRVKGPTLGPFFVVDKSVNVIL